jgi:hypothetical protein
MPFATPILRVKMTVFLSVITLLSFAQAPSIDALKPDPEKERMYRPYLAARHGGFDALEKWKQSNTVLYFKELWYFCESFTVIRNYNAQGIPLNESIIDITRFEGKRMHSISAIVQLPGFKDVLELKPETDLLYKPNYNQ